MYRGIIPIKYKEQCIRKWIEILYNHEVDMDLITNEIKQGISKVLQELRRSQGRIHINFGNIVDRIPEEIDKRLPNYIA
jgi:hypothetical protein